VIAELLRHFQEYLMRDPSRPVYTPQECSEMAETFIARHDDELAEIATKKTRFHRLFSFLFFFSFLFLILSPHRTSLSPPVPTLPPLTLCFMTRFSVIHECAQSNPHVYRHYCT
jgi:hypothetical protein